MYANEISDSAGHKFTYHCAVMPRWFLGGATEPMWSRTRDTFSNTSKIGGGERSSPYIIFKSWSVLILYAV